MISERTFVASFPSFWQELFPLLTSRFMGIFNEAYEKTLANADGAILSGVPITPTTRADIVSELAFRSVQLAQMHKIPLRKLMDFPEIYSEASTKAFELVQRYDGRKPELMKPFSQEEISEGLMLAENYSGLFAIWPQDATVEFLPQFPGCGFLNAAEGDLCINDTLIEVKTTTRKVSGKDLRQLITYLALDSTRGLGRWSSIAIFNPRRGTLHRAEIAPLMLRLSGGRTRVDVLGEIVDFAQTYSIGDDRRF